MDGHPTTSANRAIVSIRGFAEEFTRNVLVLVDGRKVVSADSGGTYWAQLPVQMEDIDRIEIIRGPSAALYGSGAGLGVINIITKKPSSDTVVALDERGGSRGTVQSYESVNASIKQFAYRLSHTYLQQGGFGDTDGDPVAHDFFHSNKANVRSHWSPLDGSELELFAGGSWNNNGLENDAHSQDHFDQHFEMLKYSQQFGDRSRVEVLSSRNDYVSDITPPDPATVAHLRNYEYDEQILHQIDWGDGRMKSTYGFDYQLAQSNSQQAYPGTQAESQIYRGYLNQTARITSQILWVGAFSWDARDNGKPHPNYQLSQLWEPAKDQTFRLSYSVAHTIPTLTLLNANSPSRVPQIFGNPDLQPETITSYETGYRGSWLEERLLVDTDLFYTVVDHKDESVFSPDPVPNLTFDNLNKAIARGAELQLKYRFSPKRSMYVNYTYEHISDTFGNLGEVTQNTPAHVVNMGGMADLGHGFSGSFNLGYKDSYYIEFLQNALAAPAYWRLDARLDYTLPWYKDAEMYVAGQNLTASTHQEYADGLFISRTFQGGVTVKFGGRS